MITDFVIQIIAGAGFLGGFAGVVKYLIDRRAIRREAEAEARDTYMHIVFAPTTALPRFAAAPRICGLAHPTKEHVSCQLAEIHVGVHQSKKHRGYGDVVFPAPGGVLKDGEPKLYNPYIPPPKHQRSA